MGPGHVACLVATAMRSSGVTFAAVAVVFSWASDATADEPGASDVRWKSEWRRTHAAEYVLVPTALVGAFALRFGYPLSGEPNWRGGVLFDDAVFEAARTDDATARRLLNAAGDVALYGSFLWSTTEPIIAGLAHDWDVANQMFWISLEAYAAFSVGLYTLQAIVHRERPAATLVCSDADRAQGRVIEGYDVECGSAAEVRSFIGGHVAAVATATSLTCIHHAHLPLYGGGVPEALPCAAGVAATGLTFAARTVGGAHYFSDNFLGLGLGALAGGLVPYALHYGWDPRSDLADEAPEAELGMPRLIGGSITPTEHGGLSLDLIGVL